jgi:hypothetical protein
MGMSCARFDYIFSKPIISLPEKEIRLINIKFSKSERGFYDNLFKKVKERFGEFLKAGTVMRNYVLSM